MGEIIEKIDDLIKQATTERSHYYTASVLLEARQTILDLRRSAPSPQPDAPEGGHNFTYRDAEGPEGNAQPDAAVMECGHPESMAIPVVTGGGSHCCICRTREKEARWIFCWVFGHKWITVGGRGCPKNIGPQCSQPVYQCIRCGEYDYGEQGGPGWENCYLYCREKEAGG